MVVSCCPIPAYLVIQPVGLAAPPVSSVTLLLLCLEPFHLFHPRHALEVCLVDPHHPYGTLPFWAAFFCYPCCNGTLWDAFLSFTFRVSFLCVNFVFFKVFAEGDEEDEDGDADEPPAPVVKLRGKKVRRNMKRVTRSLGGLGEA